MKFSNCQHCPPFSLLSLSHALLSQNTKRFSHAFLSFVACRCTSSSSSFSSLSVGLNAINTAVAFPPSSGNIMHYLRENNTRCLVAGCPAKLKLDKVKDNPLVAADIDELCKTQNQNVMTDVMDVTEFEE